MKKHLFLASVAALGLMMGACSNDIDAPMPEGDGTVTFTAQLPAGVQSRYGEGTSATLLRYAVYEANTKNVIFTSEVAEDLTKGPDATYNDLTFTLKLNLVKGKTYDLVFWAQNPGTDAYEFSPKDQTIKVNYEGITGNDEARDAFFNKVEGLAVKGAMQKSIELYRPFAQLNIATRDLEVAQAAGVNHQTTTVTVDDVATSLNLMSGEADASKDNITTVTFPAHTLANTNAVEHKNADGTTTNYHYLSMNYILTGSVIADNEKVNEAQKENKDVTITFNDSNDQAINTFKMSATPFQRNYRTNIYGALLTSEVEYTIEIKPGFEGEFNEKVSDYEIDEEGNMTISSLVGLQVFADKVNSGNNFAGKTVTLDNDIDMSEVTNWVPIASSDKNDVFCGTFDGNGHTIKNLTLTSPSRYAVGLFGYLNNGTIKNLKMSNVTITDAVTSSGIGAVVGNIFPSGLVDNCTVENVTITGNRRAGGVVGKAYGNVTNCKADGVNITLIPEDVTDSRAALYDNADKAGGIIGMLCESKYTFTNNHVTNSTISAFRDLGGVAGHIASPISNCSAKDVTLIYVPAPGEMKDDETNKNMGAIYGRYDATYVNPTTLEGLTSENVTMLTGVDGANGFYFNAADEQYYITSAEGFQAWNQWWLKNNCAHVVYKGRVFNIVADIDASAITWTHVWTTPPSNTYDGFIIDGHGHTISNLHLSNNTHSCGLFGGSVCGGNEGTKQAEIKNLTFKNCSSTTNGYFHAGIIVSQLYGKAIFENVHIIDCQVSGSCNVGAFVGATCLDTVPADVQFINCSVNGCTISATGGTGVDPTGASVFLGRALFWDNKNRETTVLFSGCSAEDNTINNAEGLVGGTWWATAHINEGTWVKADAETAE